MKKLILYALSFQMTVALPLKVEAQTNIDSPNRGSTAGPIYIRPAGMSDFEYEAQKLARPSMVTYDQYVEKNLVSEEIKENLRQAFLSAQESFLKSELQQIAEAWQEVVGFAFKADWAQPQREMISIAYLRLAQMAESSEKTKLYVASALNFDPTYVPDHHLFPPPLVEIYEAMRKKIVFISVPTKGFQGFSTLLVNGRAHPFSGRTDVALDLGLKRITLVSAMYEPVSRVLEAEDLKNFSPQRVPAKNPSKDVQLTVTAKSTSTKIVESKVGRLRPVGHLNTIGPLPVSLTPSIDAISPEALAQGHTPTPDSSSRAFYQKKNFWISAGLIAGALIILQNSQKEKSDHAPTHREGF